MGRSLVNPALVPIGEIARHAGVRASLIRYYERIGLLHAPERVSGQRRYDLSILERLAVIDSAQRAGLSLDEIRSLLEAGGDPRSEPMRALAARKVPEIDTLIDSAERVRHWLTAGIRAGGEVGRQPAAAERQTG
jgi:DNA-binding transcriptional MerR regulator